MKKIVLSCYVAFVTVAIRHIIKRTFIAVNAVIWDIIMTTIAAGVVEAAKIDSYIFALKYGNFTSSERIVFSFLACWSFIEVSKPVDAFRRLVVAQSDIIKEQRFNVFVFAESAIYAALQKVQILFRNYTS